MRRSPVSRRRPHEQNRPGGGQQRAGRAWRGRRRTALCGEALKVGRLSTGLQQVVEEQKRDSDRPADVTRVTQQGLGARLKWNKSSPDHSIQEPRVAAQIRINDDEEPPSCLTSHMWLAATILKGQHRPWEGHFYHHRKFSWTAVLTTVKDNFSYRRLTA